jgi:hypothetical protein
MDNSHGDWLSIQRMHSLKNGLDRSLGVPRIIE